MSTNNCLLIDSHSHLQFPQYDKDREEVIKRSIENGIGIICIGTDFEMSKKAVELAEKYDMVWASVGLHPSDNEDFDYNACLELAKDKKVVAVGETGLDYYRTTDQKLQIKQNEVFLEHIRLAKEVNKPLIIHCRDAYNDMIEILSNYKLQNTNYTLQCVIHSFTGTRSDAQKYLDLGFYIGLNGIITFTGDYDETVLNVPLDRILLETDAPFLSPVPYRGKRNESSYVEFVGRKIAEIKRIDFHEVAKTTIENVKKLFGINLFPERVAE